MSASEIRSPQTVIRRFRLLHAIALSLLLVGMQLGSELHALHHFGEALKHTPDHSWTQYDDELCPLCTLFAGGANAIASKIHLAPIVAATTCRLRLGFTSIAVAAPCYYPSRAPPVPL